MHHVFEEVLKAVMHSKIIHCSAMLAILAWIPTRVPVKSNAYAASPSTGRIPLCTAAMHS